MGLAAPLASATAGATRCWIDQGALVAPAAFGDIAGDFLIDLAAPVSQIQDSRAAADGITTANVTGDLFIAGRRIPGMALAVTDLDTRTRRFDTVVNGVLGADVLRGLILEVSPSPCRLTLTSGPGRRLKGSLRLRVRRTGGLPSIRAMATDGVTVRSGWFALATADWATLVMSARLPRSPPSEGPSPPTRLRGLELGGRLFEQIPADPTAASPDGLDGGVGMAVLSRFRFRLDVADGWLDIAPGYENGPASPAGPHRVTQARPPKGP